MNHSNEVNHFIQSIDQVIHDKRLLRRDQPIVVGVSGGLDSMALLRALQLLALRHNWQVVAAHFNHQLRGTESDADEQFVRETCARWRVPLHVGRSEVQKAAAESGVSLEMAGRQARHRFLAEAARGHRNASIALAHQLDDQVELFLLRMLRGAGGEGFAGMKWKTCSPVDPVIALIRPFLGQRKAQILAWAGQSAVAYREDGSNTSPDFLRNRIRHQLLPFLKESFQPGLEEVMARQMEILAAENDYLSQLAGRWLRSKNRLAYDRLPLAIQRRVLQAQLFELGVAADFALIESLRQDSGPVAVNARQSVQRDDAGKLQLQSVRDLAFSREELALDLRAGSGESVFEDQKIRWRILDGQPNALPKARAGCEWFDADKVGTRVVLRHWRPGDRFQPIGMAAEVKLQDLFVNLKVASSRRRRLVVAATAEGQIWWVEGLRISERFKLDKNTTRRLKWQWQQR